MMNVHKLPSSATRFVPLIYTRCGRQSQVIETNQVTLNAEMQHLTEFGCGWERLWRVI